MVDKVRKCFPSQLHHMEHLFHVFRQNTFVNSLRSILFYVENVFVHYAPNVEVASVAMKYLYLSDPEVNRPIPLEEIETL